MPKRIQMRRTKGWRKPAGVVYVGRPSRWGNPFRVVPERDVKRAYPLGWSFNVSLTSCIASGVFASPEAAVDMYRWWMTHSPEARKLRDALHELRGKDLACWCPLDKPCHADVLLEIANR